MKYFVSILLPAFLILISSCKFSSETGMEKQDNSKKAVITVSMLADNKDHSCGMTLKDGHINDTVLYNGKIYGFCATGCKEEFLKDPEAVLKK